MNTIQPSSRFIDGPVQAKFTKEEKEIPGELPEDKFTGESPGEKRGLVLMQIDGLSHRALKEAMDKGDAPNIRRLLDTKGYALSPFQCGIATVTLPVLSSFFYGTELPGNDWYDKASGQFVDGSVYETELRKELEAKGEKGILSEGVVYSSPLSGGSKETSLTVNSLKENQKKRGTLKTLLSEAIQDIKMLKKGGYSLTKTAWNFIRDIAKASIWMRKEGVANTKLDILAPVMMSLNHNLFEKVAAAGFTDAINRGVPVMFTDFAAYDEKAHYFGASSKEAMDMLKSIDTQIGKVVDSAEKSPLKYEVLVFSDHGQTPSKLFQDVYGSKVGDMIADFAKLTKESRGESYNDGDIVFTDAYSLGNIYFNFDKSSVDLKALDQHYPQLIDFIVNHPGIGLVCGRQDGNIIIRGKDGSLAVNSDNQVVQSGQNPLTPYGDEGVILNQISNYMKVKGSGDVVIFGAYDKEKDEVIDFNKKYSLRSLHGGLGGDQIKPFIISKPEVPINGGQIHEATQLHELHDKYKKYLR